MPRPNSPFKQVRRAFDRDALKRLCEMHELDFAETYDMEWAVCEKERPGADYADFFAFRDNGSSILAVAHLDTVMRHERRTANFIDTAAGPVVYSGALDDRLGAYTILELLPTLGVNVDVLLTTGEESGRSTGRFFEPPAGKDYHWMIEFDRGGTDVVLYQYEDQPSVNLVKACGARVGDGIFSDISYMEHLEVKGFNWGVGYHDYHGPRSHAYLEDYWMMMGDYLKFHEANADLYLPHEARHYGGFVGGRNSWDDEQDNWTDDQWNAYIDGGIDAVRALDEDEDDGGAETRLIGEGATA